jgi:hypothetical protein
MDKKGRAISDSAFLQLNRFCVSLLLEFSPSSRQTDQTKAEKQHGGGFGNGLAWVDFNLRADILGFHLSPIAEQVWQSTAEPSPQSGDLSSCQLSQHLR